MKEIKYEYIRSLRLAGYLMQNKFTVRNAEQKDGVFFDFGKLRRIKDCNLEINKIGDDLSPTA